MIMSPRQTALSSASAASTAAIGGAAGWGAAGPVGHPPCLSLVAATRLAWRPYRRGVGGQPGLRAGARMAGRPATLSES